MNTVMLYFNSIKVRLELRVLSRQFNQFVVFQFHKGTIRTADASCFNLDDKLFQFHKGTIRTTFQYRNFTFYTDISIP